MANQDFDLPSSDQPTDNSGYNLPNPEEQKPKKRKQKSTLAGILSAIGHFLYEVIKTTAIIIASIINTVTCERFESGKHFILDN